MNSGAQRCVRNSNQKMNSWIHIWIHIHYIRVHWKNLWTQGYQELSGTNLKFIILIHEFKNEFTLANTFMVINLCLIKSCMGSYMNLYLMHSCMNSYTNSEYTNSYMSSYMYINSWLLDVQRNLALVHTYLMYLYMNSYRIQNIWILTWIYMCFYEFIYASELPLCNTKLHPLACFQVFGQHPE